MKMDFSAVIISDNEVLSPVDYFRYLLLLKGKGFYHIENKTFELSQHDLALIPINVEAAFSCDPQNSLLFGLIELKNFESAILTPYVFPAKDTALIHKLYDLGLENHDITLPFYENINELINQLMFTALVAVGSRLRKINAEVFEVINDINKNYTNADYDVRNVITMTGYTMNHFRKMFRDETGLTPNEFITRRRLDHAGDLFRQFKDRITIKEIAFQCGYTDPYYFSRIFKKRYGVSPQQYIIKL